MTAVVLYLMLRYSGVATLGHAGARWDTCPSNLSPCPTTSAALIVTLLIANLVLNGLEIERRSIAMYEHRITSLIHSSYANLP